MAGPPAGHLVEGNARLAGDRLGNERLAHAWVSLHGGKDEKQPGSQRLSAFAAFTAPRRAWSACPCLPPWLAVRHAAEERSGKRRPPRIAVPHARQRAAGHEAHLQQDALGGLGIQRGKLLGVLQELREQAAPA